MDATTGSYVPAPGLLADAIDGEVVIVDLRSGRVHHLNATASYIWQACAEGAGESDIATRLAEACDPPPPAADVARDVRDALAKFERLGLLYRVQGDRQ